MSKGLDRIICTIHNLEFGYDRERVRELGHEPALMRCPVCAAIEAGEAQTQLDASRSHVQLLLEVIDLKKLLRPVK